MAFDYANLTEITTIASTAGAVLTNGASETTYIRMINIHNSNTTTETVKLYLVPDSTGSVGTAGDTNKIYEEDIASNETRIIEYPVPGLMLTDENDTVQAVTDTASKVTITITGGQE